MNTTVIADPVTGEVQLELPLFFKPYHRRRVSKRFEKPSLTHQSHAESCDVNRIIDAYSRTGSLPPEKRPKKYGDVTALNKPMGELVADAKAAGQKLTQVKKAHKAKKDAEQKAILDEAQKIVAEKSAAKPPVSPT